MAIRLHSKTLTQMWTQIERRAAVVASRAVARPGLMDLVLGVHPVLSEWAWAGIRSRVWSLAAGLAALLPEWQRKRLKNFALKLESNRSSK